MRLRASLIPAVGFAVVALYVGLRSGRSRLPERSASIQAILSQPLRGPHDAECALFLDDHQDSVRQIGKDALPFLIQALGSEDEETRLKALLCLSALGKDAAPAVSALRPLLESRTDRQAYWTILCLGDIGKASLPAAPDLFSLLKHPQGCPFWEPIGETVGRIASETGNLPDGLRELLTHENSGARHGALFALGECGALAEPVIPEMVASLRDPHLLVRIQAASSLSKMRRCPDIVLPALREALDDPKPSVRCAVAKAIGDFGSEAAVAAPELVRLLQSPVPQLRMEAAVALGKIGPSPREAVPALIGALSDSRPEVRRSSAEALGKMGPAARAAIPALRTVLNDEEESVREIARKSLESILELEEQTE